MFRAADIRVSKYPEEIQEGHATGLYAPSMAQDGLFRTSCPKIAVRKAGYIRNSAILRKSHSQKTFVHFDNGKLKYAF